jgi:hypothetical protein
MKKFIIIVLILAGLGVGAPNIGQMQRFIGGCVLLVEDATLSAQQKDHALAQLSALTGITLPQAVKYICKYKDRPGKWQQELVAIRELVEQSLSQE